MTSFEPADSPASPHDEVTLRNGRTARIRLLRSTDRPAVTSLFESCSVKNLYTRFFTVGQSVVTHHIDHLFESGTGTLTYVLFRDRELLGIADVETVDESTSEIAFLVADNAHNLGVATLLLERAAADARKSGVNWFSADVLASNRQMLEVFRDAGFGVERHTDHGDVSLRMSTRLDADALSATAARHAALHTMTQPPIQTD